MPTDLSADQDLLHMLESKPLHAWTSHVNSDGVNYLYCALCGKLYSREVSGQECKVKVVEKKGVHTPIPRCEPRPTRKKRCRQCKTWLLIGEFDRDTNSPDCHAASCRTCRSEPRKDPIGRLPTKPTAKGE